MAPPPNKKRWTSVANLDMYRKVPTDLMEGSIQGSLLSWVTLIVIGVLFYLETNSFWYESHLTTHLTLDGKRHAKDKIRVAFNITMMDLKCDYVNVNVVSVLGGRETKQKAEQGFVNKYMVSEGDVKRRFQDRNTKQDDLPEFHRHRLLEEHQLHDKSVTQSLEELHRNGQDAIPMDAQSLELALDEYPFVFVDYFVGWCSHCRLFAPTWERFAEIIVKAAKEESEESPLFDMEEVKHENYTEDEMKDAIEAVENKPPIFVATVDCVQHPDLCRHEGIHSYPTIRLYVEGEHYEPDFRGHRTLHNLLQFLLLAEEELLKTENNGGEGKERLLLTEHIEQVQTWQSIHDHYSASNDDDTNKEAGISDEKLAQVEQEERSRIEEHRKNNPDDFPGCEVVGMFLLDKVPGHFYIQAQSASDTLEPTMTNVSHEIHRLEFNHSNWETHDHVKVKENREALPEDWQTIFKPMDGNVYVHHHLHQAHHHYLKLVPTNQPEYQVLQNSQLAHYTPQAVPEAKFIFDISPISVQYHKQPVKRWYDYVTSVMAIIGGTFTVAGIIQNSLRFFTEKTIQIATRRRQRRNRGNSAQQQQQFQLARPPPPAAALKTPPPAASNSTTSASAAAPSIPAQSYSSQSYGAAANRPYMTPAKGGRTPLPRPPAAR